MAYFRHIGMISLTIRSEAVSKFEIFWRKVTKYFVKNEASSPGTAVFQWASLVGRRYYAARRRNSIMKKICKVFPGPAIPKELLLREE